MTNAWQSARRFSAVLAVLLLSGVALPLPAQHRPPTVAFVLDRESSRFNAVIEATRREITDFFRPGEIELLPPRLADGTVPGISKVLQGALQDSSVSVVVTLGTIASHLLARSGSPSKPSIAATIIDASWQNIPQHDGASGVHRLAYIDQSYPVGNTLADFHRLVPFRKLAVVLDRELLQGIPQLRNSVMGLVHESTGAETVIVPGGAKADAILTSIASGCDAVYLSPLAVMPEAEYARLLTSLNARHLPTLSYAADPDVRLGALASYEPPENWQRRARRIAVDLQRIVAGDDAGTLPVSLVSAPRLTLNLTTARKIGFSPGWSVLTDAELVGVDSAGPADTLSLAEAMKRADASNLDVAAADLDVASGREDVHIARSNLLPLVQSRVTQTYTREETAAASFGQQPQSLFDGGLSFSMPIYAEQAWAGYGSQKQLQAARESDRDRVRLDVVLDAASAYLNVLRAQTLADVRRSNLYRTRSNLEVARLREGVGSASRADIYRWQGEVATARKDLIAAESQVRIATLELKRLLNRPLDQPLAQQPVTLRDPALLAQDSVVLQSFDEPARFAVLIQVLVAEALRISPELAQIDASSAAERRQHTAAGRAFWVPNLNLEGGVSNVFGRGGAGSAQPAFPTTGAFPTAPDLTWQFRVEATLPLFTGLEQSARLSQTGIELDRLEVQRKAVGLQVNERVRSALESAASSYASIALTRDAAEAATRNYELVSDSYANGVASITAVLDAQNAALTSSQSAENALHDFLLDLMRVERAMGEFGALKEPEQRQEFLQRLRAALERSGS